MRRRWRSAASTSRTTSAPATTATRSRTPSSRAWASRTTSIADERHVIFGGAGRAYDRNVFDYLAARTVEGHVPDATRARSTRRDTRAPSASATASPSTRPISNRRTSTRWSPPIRTRPRDQPDQQRPEDAVLRPVQPRHPQPLPAVDTTGTRLGGGLAHRSHDGIVFLLGNRYPGRQLPGNARVPRGADQPMGQPIPGLGTLIIAKNGIETRASRAAVGREAVLERIRHGASRSPTPTRTPRRTARTPRLRRALHFRLPGRERLRLACVHRRTEASPRRDRHSDTGI